MKTGRNVVGVPLMNTVPTVGDGLADGDVVFCPLANANTDDSIDTALKRVEGAMAV